MWALEAFLAAENMSELLQRMELGFCIVLCAWGCFDFVWNHCKSFMEQLDYVEVASGITDLIFIAIWL